MPSRDLRKATLVGGDKPRPYGIWLTRKCERARPHR